MARNVSNAKALFDDFNFDQLAVSVNQVTDPDSSNKGQPSKETETKEEKAAPKSTRKASELSGDTESSMQSDDASAKAAQKQTSKADGAGEKTPKPRDPVKKTFYLSADVYDALVLHHMLSSGSGREYSKFVNEALEQFLGKELEALKDIDTALPSNIKFAKALNILVDEDD